MAHQSALLVVDGYNVIHGTLRYQELIDEHAGGGALADVAALSRDPYGHDPFERAREALIADVAAYAQGSYDPVIVFDAAHNLSDERPDLIRAGVRLLFSQVGESADTVIERLVVEARTQSREVLLVTSDNTVRATVGGVPVTVISSALLATDIEIGLRDAEVAYAEQSHTHMTLEARLPASQRDKLWRLLHE